MRRLSAFLLLALSSSLLAVTVADRTVSADPSSSGFRSARRANRMVIVSGVRGLSEWQMGSSGDVSQLWMPQSL